MISSQDTARLPERDRRQDVGGFRRTEASIELGIKLR